MDEAAITELIDSRYELSERDTSRLVKYVARYAEGNPFFSEELLHALESDRILRETPTSTWSLGDLDEFQMPLLLRQIIDGRLSRL